MTRRVYLAALEHRDDNVDDDVVQHVGPREAEAEIHAVEDAFAESARKTE
jgi:hypothetical protein